MRVTIVACCACTIFLGCSAHSAAPAARSAPTDTASSAPDTDHCSQDVIRTGNSFAKDGNFEDALETYLQCPRETLPNVAGLIEKYPPTRDKLLDLIKSLEKAASPPRVDANVVLLVQALDVVDEHDRLLRLYQKFRAAGMDPSEQGHIFSRYLARGGFYREALESEETYQSAFRTAAEEYGDCPTDDPLSSTGLFLTSALEDYVTALVGADRTADAACLVGLFAVVAPDLATRQSDLVSRACRVRSGERVCIDELEQAAFGPDCPGWMQDVPPPMTPSTAREEDEGGGETTTPDPDDKK